MLLSRSGYTITPERDRKGKKLEKEETVGNVFTKDGHVESLKAHARVFLDSIRSRKLPPAEVEVGHYATNPGHLMNIAWRVGRKIRWDPDKEEVLDDAEANALVTKKYRAPWKLEV
jgi:hypothetical protein